jgi:hypothetical protein
LSFAVIPSGRGDKGSLSSLFIEATNAFRYFFFFPVPFSDDELFEVSEPFADSEDFDSLDFESPAFSLAFEPSPELSEDELSGFFPA